MIGWPSHIQAARQAQFEHAQRNRLLAEYNERKRRILEAERIAAMPRYDGVTNIPVVKRRKAC